MLGELIISSHEGAPAHLQGFVLVFLHGGDALMLGVDVGGHAGFHHGVISRWSLSAGGKKDADLH